MVECVVKTIHKATGLTQLQPCTLHKRFWSTWANQISTQGGLAWRKQCAYLTSLIRIAMKRTQEEPVAEMNSGVQGEHDTERWHGVV